MNKATNLLKNLIISAMPKWYNKRVTSKNGLWNFYFARAEQHMDSQWNGIIWPVIQGFNFENVLELAPGAGRNTEKLAQVSKTIHAIDMNEYALDQLRARFKEYQGPCKLHIHKNDGSTLPMLADASITFIYCWDAAVHFDKTVIRDYVKEFSRILKANGAGFIHHSTLGAAAKPDIRLNPHGRSNMTKELFVEYCNKNGLQVTQQIDLPWGGITDCISVFRKGNLG